MEKLYPRLLKLNDLMWVRLPPTTLKILFNSCSSSSAKGGNLK